MIRTARSRALAMVTASLLAGCASPAATATPTAVNSSVDKTTAPTGAATPLATAPAVTLDGDFEVASDGRTLHLTCLGVGSPTVLLEAGHPSGGISQFLADGQTFTNVLAGDRRVCAYNRAGYGTSDPAPV